MAGGLAERPKLRCWPGQRSGEDEAYVGRKGLVRWRKGPEREQAWPVAMAEGPKPRCWRSQQIGEGETPGGRGPSALSERP
ncbi:hypothetical protein PSAB_16480 [Paenibacillus sabinae T27]|uniref:Uncharacterized protein n=1 Tax=Paenibacillus sabinae T27 TaxID=1268072 RepID=X5A1F1_9BACL|nr:hypothetical protein PSAB_16480 [Paenibacillus sabinae T27]